MAYQSTTYFSDPNEKGFCQHCGKGENTGTQRIVFLITLYHTIRTFNNPKEESFRKYCGKSRKCWLPAFSPFPTVFSTVQRREIIILARFNLSSANALSLDKSKILSFGKGLMFQIQVLSSVSYLTFQLHSLCVKMSLKFYWVVKS